MNFNNNNTNKRYFDNSDNSGPPPFKRQRGSFQGNPNFNNPGRQNFNRGGRGSFPGRQNFNRGRGPYHGGQNFNQVGRGGRGGRGGGSFRGQRGGFFPRGRFNRGSFPWHRGGSFRNSSRRSENNNVIEVTFPNSRGSFKEIFTDVLDNCDMILRPRPISSTCSLEEVQEKMLLLKEIEINGSKLNLTVSTSSIHLSKKTIQLPEKFASEGEKIKEFFGAESIEPVKSYKEDRYIPMHILTFASEKAAKDASSKVMDINRFTIGLKNYYNVETLYSDADNKTDMNDFNENAKAVLEKANSNVEDEKNMVEEDNLEENEVVPNEEEDEMEQEEENEKDKDVEQEEEDEQEEANEDDGEQEEEDEQEEANEDDE